MRSITWGGLFVFSLVCSTVATGKELSPREIYEQEAPGVVMVMGYADGGRKGSGGTGSIIQSDGLVLTNADVVIESRQGNPLPVCLCFSSRPESRRIKEVISPEWSAPKSWRILNRWTLRRRNSMVSPSRCPSSMRVNRAG